ncbi:hypothetical protein [Scytonema sp. NUACC21]
MESIRYHRLLEYSYGSCLECGLPIQVTAKIRVLNSPLSAGIAQKWKVYTNGAVFYWLHHS